MDGSSESLSNSRPVETGCYRKQLRLLDTSPTALMGSDTWGLTWLTSE